MSQDSMATELADCYVFPASRAQQQLFYIQHLVGESSVYHVPLFFELTGPLDETALHRAVVAAVGRHEALRTRFQIVDGSLRQVVQPGQPLSWVVTDCASAADFDRFVATEANRPFDLERGPLVRSGLVRRAMDVPVFWLAMHHIVIDGWSLAVLLDEITQLYQGFLVGRTTELAERAFQYADYAAWQEEWLQGAEAARQRKFWTTQLAGELPVLRLPPDHSSDGSGGRRHQFVLPGELASGLRALTGAAEGSLFTVLLTGYAILLSSYTGVTDVIVGTPIANRSRVEFERTVGLFVNSVAVRTQIDRQLSFTELLRQVRSAAFEAIDNGNLPFEEVVDIVNPARSLDTDPIFQAMFNFSAGTTAQAVAGDLRMALLPVDTRTAKYQLMLEVDDRGEQVTAALEGRAELFSAARLAEFADRLVELLTEFTRQPDQPIELLLAALAPQPAATLPDSAPALPDAAADWPAAEYIPPRSPIERRLAELWQEVLGVPTIGIEDNFYQVGGDSILSVALLGRCREAGLAFSLRDLLLNQTIAELAKVVTATEPVTDADPGLPPFGLVADADRELLPDGLADAYPMTFTQAGMVYHGDTAAISRLYHTVVGYRIRGPYSESAWRAAVAALVDRHEILRCSFLLSTSEPLLLVHRAITTPISFEDLTDLDTEATEAAVEQRFAAERERGFDWSRPPLIRYHVQRLALDEVQLWVVEHHAIIDGWSGRSLFVELLDGYRQSLAGEPVGGPPPAARFRSAVVAERAALASAETRQFWLGQLAEVSVTELPSTAAQGGLPDMVMTEQPLPDGLSEQLTALAGRLGVPLRTVLLAAHLRVLALATGGPDVVTGVVYNGRPEVTDGDKVIGMFLNALPFRCRTDAGSWSELILRVAAQDVEIQPRRHFPMPEIQRLTRVSPLVETFFNYTHFHVLSADRAMPLPAGSAVPDGEVVVVAENSVVPTNFPFGAEFFREVNDDRIRLALRRDRSRYDEADAERLHGYYVRVLTTMTERPEGDPSGCLLPAAELAQLAAWNDTAVDYPQPHLLHVLVAEQAGRTPDQPALRYADRTLNYRELDHRANGVAHWLVRAGVRPGDFVGVCMRRSPELVIGLLAILKAGAAYVPIDPDDPPARQAGMVTEADSRLVLCDADTTQALAGCPAECLVLEDSPGVTADLAPAVQTSPAEPAYLIYTSGSTGRPKGVVGSHRAAANRLLWIQDEFGIGLGDAVLQKTRHTFDASVGEIFWPLLTGATLVLARPGGHRDPAYLAELIRDTRITTLYFVPSMLRAFLDHLEQLGQPAAGQAVASLRWVTCSGEALLPDLRQRFYEHFTDTELVNLYGPTEAALEASWWRCRPDDRGPVPIGRPIANMQLHVLDPAGQPVPVGAAGEIYLGGTGLAEGYYRQPELTAQRFAVHRLVDGRLERLYRTGDLGRRLRGGELEYLGRLDNQVKIRGFRVELGEIETALAGHPQVRKCAVQLVADRLVGYLVTDSPRPSVAALRSHLLGLLPEHMVPTDWLWLNELPLSSNGKLDRRQLPAVDRSEPAGFGQVPPSTPLQRRLAEIWQDVLGVEPVGLTDRFADLGGHSLLALRLSVAIGKALGCTVTLSDLLDNDSVGKLAEVLATRTEPAADDAPVLVPLRGSAAARTAAERPRPPLVLVHPSGGDLFCYRSLVDRLAPDRPVFGIGAAGLAGGEVPDRTVEEMAMRYLDLLAGQQLDRPYHLAGWSFGALIALEMADRLTKAGQPVASLCLIDMAYPGHHRGGLPSEEEALRLFVEGLRPSGPASPAEEGWLAELGAQPTTRDKFAWLAARFAGGSDTAELERRWQVNFAVFQAHLQARDSYRPPRYAGDCLFISGHETTAAGDADQWRAAIDGRLRVQTVDAGHYSILRPPTVAETAGLLNRLLAEGDSACPA